MLDKRSGSRLANLWDDAKAEGMSGPELLVYRSNTLNLRTIKRHLDKHHPSTVTIER